MNVHFESGARNWMTFSLHTMRERMDRSVEVSGSVDFHINYYC